MGGTLETIFALLGIVLNTALGLTILSQKDKKPYHWAYGFFALNLVAIAVSLHFFRTAPTEAEAWQWLTAYHYLGSTAALVMLYFCYLFPQKLRFFNKDIIVHILAVSGLLFLYSLAAKTQYGVIGSLDMLSHNNLANPGKLFPLFGTILIIYILAISLTLVAQYVRARGDKKQISYILVGILFFVLCGVTFAIILPWLGVYSFIALTPISASFVSLAFFYAILRHQLFDIRIILRKSAVYSVLVGAVIIGYLLILEIARSVDLTGIMQWIESSPLTAVDGYQFSLPVSLTFFSALINAGIGLFLLSQRKSKEIISYGAFAVLIGICYVFMAAFQASRTAESITTYVLLFSFFGGLIGPTFLLFSLYYSGKRLAAKWIFPIFLPILAIFSLFFASTQTFISDVNLSSGFPVVNHNWGRTLSDSIWFIYILLAYFVLITSYRNRQKDRKKDEHKYLIVATAFPFAIALIIHIYLPARGDYSLTFLGPLTSWFFIAITAFLILRHQLFDIRVILRKSFVYSAMIAAVFAAYFIIIELVRVFRPEESAGTLQVVFLVALVLLSLLFPLLKQLEKLSEKLIFSQYQQSRHRLLALGEQLLQTTDLRSLTSLFAGEVNAVYAPAFIDIWGRLPSDTQLRRLHLLGDSPYTISVVNEATTEFKRQQKTQQLHRPSNEPTTSLTYVGLSGQEVTLCLFIGQRGHEEQYTFQDIHLLEDLCRFLATSLRHALVHEQQRELLLLKEHQIHTADAALSELEAEESFPSPIAPSDSQIDEVTPTPLADRPSLSQVPLTLSKKEIATALRKFYHPSEELIQQFSGLNCIERTQRDNQCSPSAALKTLLTEIIDYFQPTNDVGIRTRNRIKYEILRMMAHDSATEEQIMWELGFEPESDFWARVNPDKVRSPRYPYQGKGDYAATSRASFKRLKQESLADVLWRLEVVEKG